MPQHALPATSPTSLTLSSSSSRRIQPYIHSLHHRFQAYGKNAREWMRKCIIMLPEIDRERVWEKKGFGSLTEYAGRLAGMSHETVVDGLRIMRIVEHMSDILKVVEKRGIAIVRPVLTLLREYNQQFWAEKMREMSQHALETYVRELKYQHDSMIPEEIWLDTLAHASSSPQPYISADISGNFPTLDIFGRRAPSETVNLSQREDIQITTFQDQEDASSATRTSIESEKLFATALSPVQPHKQIIPIDLTPATLGRLQKLKGTQDWDTLMSELMDLREELLEQKQEQIQKEISLEQAEAKGQTQAQYQIQTQADSQTETRTQNPIQPGKQTPSTCSRYIPARIRHFIMQRSRGICEYPRCTGKYAIIHHTQRFALQKVHDPRNMIALCTQHERLAHLGLISDENQHWREWQIRQQPDTSKETYIIDEIVQKYRTPNKK